MGLGKAHALSLWTEAPFCASPIPLVPAKILTPHPLWTSQPRCPTSPHMHALHSAGNRSTGEAVPTLQAGNSGIPSMQRGWFRKGYSWKGTCLGPQGLCALLDQSWSPHCLEQCWSLPCRDTLAQLRGARTPDSFQLLAKLNCYASNLFMEILRVL